MNSLRETLSEKYKRWFVTITVFDRKGAKNRPISHFDELFISQ
jgi:hypothetical protein